MRWPGPSAPCFRGCPPGLLDLAEQLGLLGVELLVGERTAVAQLRELGDPVERVLGRRSRGLRATEARATGPWATGLWARGSRRTTGRHAQHRGAGRTAQPGRP